MSDSPSTSAAKILLVEDDVAITSAVRTLLNHYEYDVSVARTLVEGRSQLANSPDLVILDLVLPDGDGLDLLERMRRLNSPARVMVLTASTDPDHTRRITRLKPARYFRKPLNFFQLLDAIRQEVLLIPAPARPAQTTLI
jgi:DNA-binding response OmpR family regulator